jgi:hypothetical protein
MRLAYLAGPYRSSSIWGVKRNIEAAAAVARELWKMGLPTICPHCNTAFMDGPDIECSTFLDGDLEMLERSDLMVVLPGWEKSQGTIAEIEHVLSGKCGDMKIYYWPEDRQALETIAAEPPACRKVA